MTAGSDPGSTQMPIQPQPQPQPGGSGCQKVMGALTLLLLVVMLVLGMLVWNAVGGFFDGIGQGISGLGESIGGTVGEGFESLGNTVSGISQGITDLGASIAALPQTVAENVMEALEIEKRASVELRDLIAHSVQPVGHLVTASNPVDTKVKVGIKAGLFNLCDASVDHDVEGTIEAGVDLSQVQGSNFTHDLFTNSWTLQLGPAQVTSCRIDYIRQTGHSRSICRQDWDEYRLLAETVVLPEFRNLALAEGLLAKAEQEAQLVLGNFLRAVTKSENVSIVFQSDPTIEFPESCLREPPPGWTFDEESDTWKRE